MQPITRHFFATTAIAAGLGSAHADAVIDWNTRAGELIVESRMGTPPAVRVMAILQTAVHEAVADAARREPRGAGQAAAIDAAVAAANRAVLTRLLPAQERAVTSAYTASLAAIPDAPARAAGVEAGEKAAKAVLAARADDGAAGPGQPYRPHAAPGAYVPTAATAAPHWGQRKPWLLSRPDQLRPAAPASLTSATWARDYNEVKTLGSKSSTSRTAEQSEVARFWEFSLPSIYFGVARPVAAAPGRKPADNARMYAALAQSMDDSLIAVFDAKYHYNFWRPATAIRNGDADGNDATEREAGWTPLTDAPLHPEYPSAHSILAAAVGTVLKAEIGSGATPVLSTSSPSAQGTTRRWSRIDDFVQEVANARIWEGIHYRFSTETGLHMGQRIGELAVTRFGDALKQAAAQPQ
jgi:hypothetical protein